MSQNAAFKRLAANGPLITFISNENNDSNEARKVKTYPATHLDPAGPRQEGRLAIGGGVYSFTGNADRQGWPSVKGSYGPQPGSITYDDGVVAFTSKDSTDRFLIDRSSTSDAEFQVLLITDLQNRVAPYASPIVESCEHDSWPNISHPFFQTHASARTDRRAVLELLAWSLYLQQLVFMPLPWLSSNVNIRQWKHCLLVSRGQGSETYCYRETDHSIVLSYETHEVGFFDDSEYDRDEHASLTFITEPSEDIIRSAKSLDKIDDEALADRKLYLKNPFNMSGIFLLTR